MTCLVLNTDVVPHKWRSICPLWSVIEAWRLLLVVVVAVTLTGGPGKDSLRVEKAEPVESSAPIEECVDAQHLQLSRRFHGVRKPELRIVLRTAADAHRKSRVGSLQCGRRRAINGHCLANDLRAPLIC